MVISPLVELFPLLINLPSFSATVDLDGEKHCLISMYDTVAFQ